MKKMIKWILLIISIVLIIITVVIFIQFKENYGYDDKKYDKNNDDDISEIYGKNWFNVGFAIYEDDKLTSEETVIYSKYMTLTKDIIKYCDTLTKECEEYNYTYSNNIINMPIDYFVFKGKYELSFDEENLYLSYSVDNVKVVYHFEASKG